MSMDYSSAPAASISAMSRCIHIGRLLDGSKWVCRRIADLEEGSMIAYYSLGGTRVSVEIGDDGEMAYIKGEPGKEPEIRDIDTTNLEAELKTLFGL